MAKSITAQYKAKRENAEQRGIEFKLSLEEYKVYQWFKKNGGTCDYTGVPFTSTGENIMSIERINKNGAYSFDNCCLVTVKANGLKDTVVDEGCKTKITLADLEVMNKIKELVKSPENLTKKYFDKYNEMWGENVVEKEPVSVPHDDVEIAKNYISFAKNNSVSFSKYKSLLERKTCQITRTPFKDDMVFITTDDNVMNDSNILVVKRCVSGILKSGMTKQQLNRLIEFIK
jgi:hypothetical protein